MLTVFYIMILLKGHRMDLDAREATVIKIKNTLYNGSKPMY